MHNWFVEAVGARGLRRRTVSSAVVGVPSRLLRGVPQVGAVQHGPAGVPLKEHPELVPEGFPQEAVDQGVQTAVGERRQADHVGREGVLMPQCSRTQPTACTVLVRVAPQKVNADEDVLGEPAEEEDEHGS